MSQWSASSVDSIQGALQECTIDFYELCVRGLFHVCGKHDVGDAGKNVRWQTLAGEKVRAVMGPFGLQWAAGYAVDFESELVILARNVGANRSTVAGYKNNGVSGIRVGREAMLKP